MAIIKFAIASSVRHQILILIACFEIIFLVNKINREILFSWEEIKSFLSEKKKTISVNLYHRAKMNEKSASLN